jgi:type III pantothenate kinase
MLLVIDVGNTNTVLGVFAGDVLTHHWRLQTHQQRTGDEYSILLSQLLESAGVLPRQIEGVIIACVVPPLVRPLRQMCDRTLDADPIYVDSSLNFSLPILYDNPREVGADRIVNAIAGIAKYDRALIICDFGTATTFDAINEKGEYMGGVIAPGITISAEALFQRASMLPKVSISAPEVVIGRNTVESMKSGLLYGYAGLVGGIIRRMKAEMESEPLVIATGGLASVIAAEAPEIVSVEPLLTLEGLRLLWERNPHL